ncbi:MAG: tautomerase family protein [Bacillota bacterium]|nr:tautomerase family protein [Bacillota bacterium]
MPVVTVSLREGRTVEQKRALVQEVTKAVVSTVNCPEDAVMVLIHDLKSEDIGKAG